MNNTPHVTGSRQKILIVSEHHSSLVSRLKEYLRKFDNDIYVSPKAPGSLAQFDYCFFVDDTSFLKKREEHPWKKITLIISKNRKRAVETAKTVREKNIARVKIVFCPQVHALADKDIEEIVWFAVSPSSELFLSLKTNLVVPPKPVLPQAPPQVRPRWYVGLYLRFERFLSKRNIAVAVILAFFAYHFAFVAPLGYAGFLMWRASQKLGTGDLAAATVIMKESNLPIQASKRLYGLVRPTFLLFSAARIPDDIFSVHGKMLSILDTSQKLQDDAHEAFVLVLKKGKTEAEKRRLLSLISSLKGTLSELENEVTFLNQKIPDTSLLRKYKDRLTQASGMISKAKRLTPFLSELLAEKGTRKYLLLFANNMELRPGGGFIGSYGVLTMTDLTFSDLQVYDVYDADGQLTAHVEPPAPIKNYLSQPHWFLRDSAFSPDFYENYFQAKYFLDKEKQLTDFSGGILVTTTAIKNILAAYGDLYVPDYGEKVNADNFYLKTQLYAEKNFFPGSTQKKSFLSALTRQILVNLETVSERQLAAQVFKSAEEKQLVFYFEMEDLQKIVDSYYWAGRIIEPQCPPQVENCYTDFMFPYDANLGVNKANFFMNRAMETKINIDAEGIIHSSLTVKFRNEAIQDVFPGGNYRNYFQILIPRDSVLNAITVDGAQVHDFDQDIGQFKKIGFFIEIPVHSTREVTVEYQSMKGFKKGKAVYQLLFQKQIGSINNDMSLQITLPPGMFLVNQNFSPLVNQNQINYNTELSADKIFFIELLKE